MPSCGSFPEFSVLSQAVTAACCTAGVECPPGGIPASCTAECASVLLPMQAACADFLGVIGMADTVAAAVATCPAQCTPHSRCQLGFSNHVWMVLGRPG